MSAERESKVIGYYALSAAQHMVCSAGAALISGSESASRRFVEEFDPSKARTYSFHKVRFGEMLPGLQRGAPYAFDEVSYGRFYPLALEAGLPVTEGDFAEARKQGMKFLIFRLVADPNKPQGGGS